MRNRPRPDDPVGGDVDCVWNQDQPLVDFAFFCISLKLARTGWGPM